MQPKRFLGHLWVSRQEYILSQASLLPKDGDGAPDLHMADEEASTDDHDLLSLTKVGNIAHVIDASGVVASARSIPHSARNESQLSLQPAQLPSCLRKVALYERCEPPAVDLLPDEVAIKCPIPEILVVASNQLERIRILLLHPGEVTLAGGGQIIAVGEVEAIY